MARPASWSDTENDATVRSYFTMLKRELSGADYVKKHENEALRKLIDRPAGAVEYKHQNISAVLMRLGWLWIEGYKPARNSQKSLVDAITRHLAEDRELELLVQRAAVTTADIEPLSVAPDVVSAPDIVIDIADWEPRTHGFRRDYLFRDEQNRNLGLAGELTALAFERERLARLDRPDLARRVEHVSRTRGDGLGYDILSFGDDGSEKYIEVKTTRHAKETPFFATANEVRASAHFGPQFSVYRLFKFAAARPGMYLLDGAMDSTCVLTPSEFLAAPRA